MSFEVLVFTKVLGTFFYVTAIKVTLLDISPICTFLQKWLLAVLRLKVQIS